MWWHRAIVNAICYMRAFYVWCKRSMVVGYIFPSKVYNNNKCHWVQKVLHWFNRKEQITEN